MSEDLSHDPHLRAALRHAPDHALAPPAGVSQTILNAARHVHKPARPAATPAPAVRITVAPPRAVAWLRQWFASPRLAGGLATGLVAALGLGLWIDLGREPVVDRAPPAPANEQRASDAAPVEQPVSRDRADMSSRTAELTRNVETVTPNAAHETPPVKRGANEAKVERRVERVPLQHSAPPAAAAPQRREDPASEPERALAKATPAEPETQTAVSTPRAMAPTAPAPSAAPAPAVADAPAGAQKAASDAVEAQREVAARSDMRMSSAAGRAAALAGARAPAGEPLAETAAAASPAFTLLR
ncbi:MAG TPA: hypothetical protein VFO28_09780, partial [Burkholderiaceae bacterium]|nr:hypothetical protein [Burkholderiaceae bacterium]